MAKARIVDRRPMKAKLSPGEHFWCACGRSASQPMCDGSHRGTGIEPVAFQVEEEQESWFCMCKQSRDAPRCDGAHKDIPEGVEEHECPG
jgi:CDGSH-type Zn-finger protein